jgi:hypothetical protein
MSQKFHLAKIMSFLWRHDTQQNDTQLNDFTATLSLMGFVATQQRDIQAYSTIGLIVDA